VNPSDHIEREELLTPGPAEALANLLDLSDADIRDGAVLPPLWHWVYLLERPRQSALGPDGHPLTGIPAPPGPGRSRMYGGGRVRTLSPLRIGEPARRRTWLVSEVEKDGRNGAMTLATVRSEITQDGRVAVVEDSTILYRSGGRPLTAATTVAEPPPGDAVPFSVDERVLFRFSALTYNAHRIHYDRDYARSVEGYPDLVVHGPLQALLMAEHARRRGADLAVFEYRLVAPLFLGQGLVTRMHDEAGLSVTDADGRTTAVGTLTS
jgi:3-methylfumaryl-CoA hydratase